MSSLDLQTLNQKLQANDLRELDCFTKAVNSAQSLNPLLHALTNVDPDRIIKDIKSRESILPLSGIPLVVDDSLPIPGFDYIYGPEKKIPITTPKRLLYG